VNKNSTKIDRKATLGNGIGVPQRKGRVLKADPTDVEIGEAKGNETIFERVEEVSSNADKKMLIAWITISENRNGTKKAP
jgi:hypothetical protein